MLKSIQAAQRQVAKLMDVAKGVIARAQREGREELCADEHAIVEEAIAEAEAIQVEIDQEEPQQPPLARHDPSLLGRVAALEERRAQFPRGKTQIPLIEHHPYGPHGGMLPRVDQRYTQVDPRSYAGMFGHPAPSPWRSNQEFIQAIYYEQFDPRLRFEAALNEAQGSAGGFMVPAPMAATIMDKALHQEVVRPRATVISMTSRTIFVPAWDGRDQSSGLFGMTDGSLIFPLTS